MPVSARYRPDPLFAKLGPEFADPVAPARFPQPVLRWRNDEWAARVGLDTLTDTEWDAHFLRFEPLPDNMPGPLAMRYHGHQFRVYNPELGDGRGFLAAQLRDDAGRLLDIGTKGSGQTPYSRRADGRLTLKGGVREVLGAEMADALGVYTSKALSLYETGEAVVRHDEPGPTMGSLFVRLSHSHVRFGTFQRLAFFEQPDLMRVLVDHCVEAYAPALADRDAETRAAGLLEHATRESARLTASWMAAGFIHGVLNTDNLSINGECFDYGPWRFLPFSDPRFIAASFDEIGLYAFGRQPEAASWALAQLAGALSLIAPIPPLEAALGTFAFAYQQALRERMFARLKLAEGDLAEDLVFLDGLFGWLTQTEAGWDQFFHDWIGGGASAARAGQSPQAQLYANAAFAPVREGLESRTRDSAAALLAGDYFQRSMPTTMQKDDVENVWAPIAHAGDWGPFERKIAEVRQMRAALGLSCHRPVAGEQ